jgi:putative endonuclease
VYTLYVLLCSDNTLYTGIAKDLESRLEMHRKGKGAKYMRSRLPFNVVYTEELPSRSAALKREAEIKKWSREEKINNLRLEINNVRD